MTFPIRRIGDEEYTVIDRYDAVREAARDWEHFTSATPFRVPIPEESDVRPVRQYPIETDPPEHAAYRSLIAHRFSRSAAEALRPVMVELIDRLLDRALRRAAEGTPLQVRDELALPIVTAAIAHTMGRPGDAERFPSWGLHVFYDPETRQRRRNADLDQYLEECADAALAAPGDDIFGDLARARHDGRALTRDEMLGYGYLVLAGGRDTVIASICGAVWHLATHPDVRDRIVDDPGLLALAIEEYVRYFSPLPHIGRTVATDCELGGTRFSAGQMVALDFAAANHDPAAIDHPERCAVDRRPNRHVGFGHGPHTCIGAPLARMEIGALIERWCARIGEATVVEPADGSQPGAFATRAPLAVTIEIEGR